MLLTSSDSCRRKMKIKKEDTMKRASKELICLIAVSILLVFTVIAGAEENEGRTLSPYFFIDGNNPSLDNFPLKETDVSVNINGVIADVVVRQKYVNEGTVPINARYIFPASTRSAVHGMKMNIGNKIITAKIKEKETAKKEFEAAKSAGKSASLLSQHRPKVFMKVANIMPRDTIDIELHYTELLVPAEGEYEFVYPTVVGPRYSSQSSEGAPEDDKWIENPYLKNGSPQRSRFNIIVNLSAGMDLQEVISTSHDTLVNYENRSTAKISLKDQNKYGGNRDYILKYRLAGKKIQTGLMLFEKDQEKFFLLMAEPPGKVQEDDITPREYIFIIDVSGSMAGYPLDISKEVLRNLINSLKPTDKFNVILFAGGFRLMSQVSLPASRGNVQAAIKLIDSQQGGGGTELLEALNRALSLPRDDRFSRTVLILTDGYIGAEKEVFQTISKNLDRTNVFSFGIGSSVNRYLIEGIAKAGMGEPFIVTDPQESSGTAQRFCEYVRSPVLSNIKLDFQGFKAYDIEPGAIPDIFAERPLVVIGKWRGKAEGSIKISGESGRGKYTKAFNVSDIRPLESNYPLRYLWARERIASLSDFSNSQGDQEHKDEILSLGLTYSLLTQYTSFIAVHDEVRNQDGTAKNVDQPLPLPQGVSELAVGGSVSNVPEPDLGLMLLIGILMIGMAFIYRNFCKA